MVSSACGALVSHRGVLVSVFYLSRHGPCEKHETITTEIVKKHNNIVMNMQPRRISNGAKKILFIEDESLLQKTVSVALEQEGFEIISALDGEIGLRLAKEKNPDLVLLDLILPKMDGFEVLKALKSNPEYSHIPVVVLTNLESNIDVEHALSLGAKSYLIKANYALPQIIEKIKEFLR